MESKAPPDWEDARAWFNNMEVNSRNQLISTMYRLCMSTKESSHTKLAESLNSQWQERFNVQVNESKRLQMQNDIFQENQNQHVNVLNESIRNLESKVNESINSIALKITPSSNGKLGEDYIDRLLGNVPGSDLTNISQSKGCGDFLYKQGDIRIMIESKNWTNSSIKGNPKELTNFKNTAILAKEEGKIDYAIMALHRVTDLKGRAIDLETVYTAKGRLMLIYVTNLFNHPDRLLYAIDCGILLLQQQNQASTDTDKFLYQIDMFLKSIGNIEDSVKERTKIIKNLLSISKRDGENAQVLRQTLQNIINDTEKIPLEDRVTNYCWELIVQNGKDSTKVTKGMLEARLLENKIPARWVREMGGIKIIRKLAEEKFSDEA